MNSFVNQSHLIWNQLDHVISVILRIPSLFLIDNYCKHFTSHTGNVSVILSHAALFIGFLLLLLPLYHLKLLYFHLIFWTIFCVSLNLWYNLFYFDTKHFIDYLFVLYSSKHLNHFIFRITNQDLSSVFLLHIFFDSITLILLQSPLKIWKFGENAMPEKHMIQCAKVQRRVRQQGRSQGKMTHSRVWDPIPVRQFVHEREQTMRKMDRSVKGSIDSPIVELVELINNTTDFYTTSSCSGRVIVTGTLPEVSETQKKNLQWLYSTHELIVDSEQLIEELEKQCIENTNDRFEFDKVVFKLEPFIVHIRCRSLEAGQRFLQLALDSGFRNSGLVISGSGRITLAVRSTLALEVPLVIDHTFVSSRQYLRKLVSVANQKMVQNKKMIDRIYHNLISSRI